MVTTSTRNVRYPQLGGVGRSRVKRIRPASGWLPPPLEMCDIPQLVGAGRPRVKRIRPAVGWLPPQFEMCDILQGVMSDAPMSENEPSCVVRPSLRHVVAISSIRGAGCSRVRRSRRTGIIPTEIRSCAAPCHKRRSPRVPSVKAGVDSQDRYDATTIRRWACRRSPGGDQRAA